MVIINLTWRNLGNCLHCHEGKKLRLDSLKERGWYKCDFRRVATDGSFYGLYEYHCLRHEAADDTPDGGKYYQKIETKDSKKNKKNENDYEDDVVVKGYWILEIF